MPKNKGRLNDGRVFTVTATTATADSAIHIHAEYESDSNDYYQFAIANNPKNGTVQEQVELFLMDFDMGNTWSWQGNVGQFAYIKNMKYSDKFSAAYRNRNAKGAK